MNWVIFLIFFLLALAVPVLIGVYVYRDAAGRGMNAPLWTLVAVLAPTFVGLIIYLLVRGSYSNLSCPRCGERVQEQFAVCPACGARLKAACAACGHPAEPEWQVCPRCAAPLEPDDGSVTPPVRKQDRLLGKIIVVAVAVPLVLLVVCVLGMVAFQTTGESSSASSVEMAVTAADYRRGTPLSDWLARCDAEHEREGTAAFVRYSSEVRGEGEHSRSWTRALLYYPGMSGEAACEFHQTGGWFKKNQLEFDLDSMNSRQPGDDLLLAVEYESYQEDPQPVEEVAVNVDGASASCSAEETEEDPCAYVFQREEQKEDAES